MPAVEAVGNETNLHRNDRLRSCWPFCATAGSGTPPAPLCRASGASRMKKNFPSNHCCCLVGCWLGLCAFLAVVVPLTERTEVRVVAPRTYQYLWNAVEPGERYHYGRQCFLYGMYDYYLTVNSTYLRHARFTLVSLVPRRWARFQANARPPGFCGRGLVVGGSDEVDTSIFSTGARKRLVRERWCRPGKDKDAALTYENTITRPLNRSWRCLPAVHSQLILQVVSTPNVAAYRLHPTTFDAKT